MIYRGETGKTKKEAEQLALDLIISETKKCSIPRILYALLERLGFWEIIMSKSSMFSLFLSPTSCSCSLLHISFSIHLNHFGIVYSLVNKTSLGFKGAP